MMKLIFHDAPRVLVAMMLGIPAIILGVIGATLRLVALTLAYAADKTLSTVQERKDQRPVADKVDPA